METCCEENIENSYMYFMKYLNLVSCIKKTPLYRGNEKYYQSILGPKNVKQAIEYAEKLQNRLQEEIDRREEEAIIRKRLEDLDIEKQLQIKMKNSEDRSEGKVPLSSKATEDKSVDDKCISTWTLDSLMKSKTKSFVIFDVRSSKDFEESHIKHPNVYSIPEDKLKPG